MRAFEYVGFLGTILLGGFASSSMLAADVAGADWNPKNAANYLDGRMSWWMSWPQSARDHEAFCISCHTVLPYALSRAALHGPLGANKAYQMAVNGDPPAATFFWLKCRAGWREKLDVEHSGKDGQPFVVLTRSVLDPPFPEEEGFLSAVQSCGCWKRRLSRTRIDRQWNLFCKSNRPKQPPP